MNWEMIVHSSEICLDLANRYGIFNEVILCIVTHRAISLIYSKVRINVYCIGDASMISQHDRRERTHGRITLNNIRKLAALGRNFQSRIDDLGLSGN